MSKNYEYFKKEDFVQDEYFIAYIKTPSVEHTSFFEEIIRKFPYIKEEMNAAQESILNLNVALKPTHALSEKRVIWANISKAISTKPFAFRVWLGAAAAIIMLSVFYYTLNRPTQSENYVAFSEKPKSELEFYKNNRTVALDIVLSDGSKVSLWPNATLKVEKVFADNTREVYLEGKAFFEIKKNSKMPFLVYTNDLVTKVLGTSFLVEQDKQTQVSVISGKVAVFLNKPKAQEAKNTLVLEPNQMVTIKNDVLLKSLVAEPKPLISQNELKAFNYTEAKLEIILKALKDIYGVDIVFDKDQIKYCTLTTSMTEESLFEKLDVICAALNGSYNVIDSKIILEITPCEP